MTEGGRAMTQQAKLKSNLVPTKKEFQAVVRSVFGGLPTLTRRGWDADSVALGFALARGCDSESFAIVEELLGRQRPL